MVQLICPEKPIPVISEEMIVKYSVEWRLS